MSRRNRYRLGMRRAIISTTTVRARMNVMRNASRARRASSSAVGATLSESPDLGRRDVIARHLGPPGPWQQTQPGRRGGAQPADAVAVSRQTIATSAPQEADRSGGRFLVWKPMKTWDIRIRCLPRKCPTSGSSTVCRGAHRLSRESMVVGANTMTSMRRRSSGTKHSGVILDSGWKA